MSDDPITKLVPLKFERLEPQPKLEARVFVPCRAKTGGVVVRYPLYLMYISPDGTLPWWFPLLRAWWWVRRLVRR